MEYALHNVGQSSTTSLPTQVHRREKCENEHRLGLPENGSTSATDIPGSNKSVDFHGPLPSIDEGKHAWLFCLSACVFEIFIWGWNNTYGIFQEHYSTHPPFDTSSAASISTIGTASLGIQHIGMLVFVLFLQRYPEYIKASVWFSLVLCVGSLLLSSFATKLWQMIVLQGVTFGIGSGLLYSPILIWLPEWFLAKRGLAGGLIFAGGGAGGFIFPLALGALLDKVGFRWTLRIWAIMFGLCCGVGLFGIKARIPVRKPTPERPRQPLFPKDLSFMKTPVFFCLTAITIVQSSGLFPVSIFISTYTSSLSSAALPPKLVLALFNAATGIFFIIFGRLCDSFPYPYVIMGSGLGCAVAVFVLWGFATSLPWIFAFTIVFGGLGGAFPAVWPTAATEVGGTRDDITTIAFGWFTVVQGVMSIVGPIIAATLHDTKNEEKTRYGAFGYRNVEIFIGCTSVATFIGGLVLSYYSTSKKKVKE
ncbi:MFS general substrate transporter [Agrocybe pediades]|nr:MFS general substrate transporter [Agrocybe pediades]